MTIIFLETITLREKKGSSPRVSQSETIPACQSFCAIWKKTVQTV